MGTSYTPAGGNGGCIPEAERITSEDIEELDTDAVACELLSEIARWKREAKAEDNDRYFLHVREVDQIARGDRYFVIGRKGSGKTAICEYFRRLQHANTYSEQLSFKNFPFNELYGHSNPQYTPPNQFITVWKNVILSTVCRLMRTNPDVDGQTRQELNSLFGETAPLRRRLARWVSAEFGVDVFGVKLRVGPHATSPRPAGWIERTDFLEEMVASRARDATYFILFDELDEDYRDIVERKQYQLYTALITSLFKAVQDVRSCLGERGARVFPVVFLRDDIYDLIQDSDKNKWGDFRVDLNWDTAKIRKVMAFRISRAIDPACAVPLQFETAWSRIFGTRPIGVGVRARNKISTFEFIARSTLLRPRDFVAYLQNCAQHALDEGTRISPTVVKRVDKAFSNYLRQELHDELFAILPDIQSILSALSHIRKWNFTIAEFRAAYARQLQMESVRERNVNFVLEVLYLYSVIGNCTRDNRLVFRYQNPEARLNFNERVVVHRGLFKSLQIM